MAGKKSKSVKQKPAKKQKPVTFEEKLSDTVKRMDEIVKGNDKRHHLR